MDRTNGDTTPGLDAGCRLAWTWGAIPNQTPSPKQPSAPRPGSDTKRRRRANPRGRAGRNLTRAVERARETANEIQGTSRRRLADRAAGRAVAAESASTDLDILYVDFRADKRGVHDAAGIPEGAEYRGRTWLPDGRREAA